MKEKLFIPCLYLLKKKAVVGWGQKNLFGSGDVLELSRFYSDHGADELLIFDFSSTDEEHEEAIGAIKEVCSVSETPVLAAGHINRMEDVK
ncbi:MAG: HisA/HisF-related TIM barrel protein, partial [Blautia hydrogenotrophica]